MTTMRTADDLPITRPPLSERLRVVVRQGMVDALTGRSRARNAGATGVASRPVTLRASGDMTEWDSVQMFADSSAVRLRAGSGPLVVDLSDVDRADTKLIACLVCLVSNARQAGRRIEIRFSPGVEAWVSLCGLEGVLGAGLTAH